MKKTLINLIFISFLAIILLYIAGVSVIKTPILQTQLKKLVIKNLESALQQKIIIDELSGNLFSLINLNNITIKDKKTDITIIKIKKLSIYYNPLKLLIYHGNFLETINSLIIEKPELTLIRTKNDHWNLLDYLANMNPQNNQKQKFPFKFNIYLKNAQAVFIDERGWRPDLISIKTPFTEKFININGTVNLRNPRKILIYVSGFLGSNKQSVSSRINLNVFTNQFKLNFLAHKLPLDKWGEYVFPLDGFKISKNNAKIIGTLTSKKTFTKTELPFYYKINILANNINFLLPFFQQPLTKTTAKILVADEGVSIKNFSGLLNNIPLQGQGNINYTGNIKLELFTLDFYLENLKKILPGFNNWQIQGLGKSKLNISGNIANPQIKGILNIKQSEFWQNTIKNTQLDFNLINQKLHFNIKNGNFENNLFSLDGFLSLTQNPEYLVNFKSPKFKPEKWFKLFKNNYSGELNLDLQLKGNANTSNFYFSINEPNFYFYNQKINNLSLFLAINKNNIFINQGFIQINDNPQKILISGEILNLDKLILKIKGDNIYFQDFKDNSPKPGQITFDGNIKADLTSKFWANPLEEISASANLVFNSGYVYQQYFEEIKIKANYSNNIITINQFIGKNGPELLEINGVIKNQNPIDLTVKTQNLNLEKALLVKKFLPIEFNKITGYCDSDIKLNTSNNFNASGNIILKNTTYLNQSIKEINTLFYLKDKNLTFKKLIITQNYSKLNCQGTFLTNTKKIDLELLPNSQIDFSEFSKIFHQHGKIKGVGTIYGTIIGTIKQPVFTLNFDLHEPKFNNLAFDQIQGQINYENQKIRLKDLLIKHYKNSFLLNGYLNLSPFFKHATFKMHDLDFDLDFKIIKCDLKNSLDYLNNLIQELNLKTDIDIKNFEISPVNDNTLAKNTKKNFQIKDEHFFSQNTVLFTAGQQNNSIVFYEKTKANFQNKTNYLSISPTIIPKIAGSIYGEIKIKTNPKNSLSCSGYFEAENIKINKFNLQKATLDIKDQPNSIYLNFIIEDKPFNSYPLKIIFDKQEKVLTINNRILSGEIPISALTEKKLKSPINLKITLIGNDINLFSLLNPSIKKIQNQGEIILKILGNIKKLLISSEKIDLQNFQLYFQDDFLIKSPLTIKENNDLIIINNKLLIPKLNITWQGFDTKNKAQNQEIENNLNLRGLIELANIVTLPLDKLLFNIQIWLEDTKLTVNYPTFYNGDIYLENLSIQGLYPIPLSIKEKMKLEKLVGTENEEGPTVSGNIKFTNGIFYIPKITEKQSDSFPLKFNLFCHINDDVAISGGFLGQDLLAGFANTFNLNIAKTTIPLKIKGSLNTLNIENKIYFVDGSVNFLDKVFTLMNENEQAQFYKEDPLKITKNSLSFSLEYLKNTLKPKLIPILNLKAFTLISADEPNSATGNITTKAKNLGVIITFNGSIYNLTSITFDEFDLGNQTNYPYINPLFMKSLRLKSAYQDNNNEEIQDIIAILMPDFLINSDRYFKFGYEGDKTKTLISNLGARQFDLWTQKFLRPIEKKLAKDMGLSDLHFDYNFGKQLLDALLGNTQNNKSNPSVGVTLATRLLSDQLFLRVKTDMEFSAETRQIVSSARLSEITLTYYILNNLSASFSNQRDTRTDTYRLIPHYSLDWSLEY